MIEFLEKYLSEKRFKHCIRTSEMAQKLCDIHNISNKAVKAALLHDCAKELSLEEMIELIGIDNIKEFTNIVNKNILHGYAGAEFCKKYLDIHDEEILSAIKYHTVGKENMNDIEKVVYISDAIEMGRNYDIVEKLRELAYISLDECILEELNYKIKNLIDRKEKIHENTIKFRNELLEKLNGR